MRETERERDMYNQFKNYIRISYGNVLLVLSPVMYN